ncbi:conserved hypothetical protein [Culex quinquefasciatus]|uniref:Uncharacterized protein n=1 Tax=Culex quinquefasciatus TaxID=7176 RepID=B0WN14_CULQU|nr:conserved hypothetical protein [Culex quinquefasciatus]|eukprot:XP_001850098.1 conserved hypothetical protein [Culex quinquefasciatus]
MIRFSLFKLMALIFLCLGFYYIARWQIILYNNGTGSTGVQQRFLHTCNLSEAYRNELEQLFDRVHKILDRQSITHILCYGTLWGQIRMAKMLPWRRKAEFCVFNEELMAREEARFLRLFYSHNLKIYYIHSEGLYRIFSDNPDVSPYVELVVFQRDDAQSMYKRVGWRRRLMPPHCDWTPSLDCFPSHLLEKVLPRRKLGHFFYHVPMGGIELQKYHYAQNWWKDVRVFNC